MKRFSIFTLLLMLGCLAWAADSPRTVLAEAGSGRVLYPTNFWTGNSTSINAVVTNKLPAGGTAGQALTKASNADWDLVWATISSGGGVTDHGALSGLAADDHPHYLTQGRGDARYSQLGHGHAQSEVTGLVSALAGKASTSHAHAEAEVTGLITDLAGKAAASHTHGLADITDEGTAASRNVPTSGDAAATEVVLGNDTRLTDARTPTTHSHNWLVPAGGSTGQSLTKASGSDGDLAWATVAGGSSPTTTRGDLIRRGASADERLPLAMLGAQLISDGTDAIWLDPTKGRIIFCDWDGYAANSSTIWGPIQTSTSSGSAAVVSGDSTHWGILRLGTSTSASGAASFHTGSGSISPWAFGGGRFYYRTLVKIVTNLSDGTETYTVRFGYGNATTGVPTDGAYVDYTHSVLSGNWRGVSRKGSTDYAVDLGVAAAADVWTLIEVDAAADRSSIIFAVWPAGGSRYTQTYSTQANITTAAFGLIGQIAKSAGTATRAIDDEYVLHVAIFTTPRQ